MRERSAVTVDVAGKVRADAGLRQACCELQDIDYVARADVTTAVGVTAADLSDGQAFEHRWCDGVGHVSTTPGLGERGGYLLIDSDAPSV